MNLIEIRKFLEERNISITELANRMQRQRSYISAILSGKKPVSDEMRKDLENELLRYGYLPDQTPMIEAAPIALAVPLEIVDRMSQISRDLSEKSADFQNQLDYLKMIVSMLVKEHVGSMPNKKEITQVVDKEPDLSVYVGVY